MWLKIYWDTEKSLSDNLDLLHEIPVFSSLKHLQSSRLGRPHADVQVLFTIVAHHECFPVFPHDISLRSLNIMPQYAAHDQDVLILMFASSEPSD